LDEVLPILPYEDIGKNSPMANLTIDKTVINALEGFYYVMKMVKFFKENEL
jgi:hypothetical protein